MSTDIALFLLQDGIVNAAIYALLALSLILVFSVTRVIYVPQGEFVSYGALTLAAMQQGGFPSGIYVLIALGLAATGYEIVGALLTRQTFRPLKSVLFIGYPVVLWAIVVNMDLTAIGQVGQVLLTFAIVVPMGAALYRVVFQPLANATILVLLIAAVAAHLVLVGIGLLIFGPEGSRTVPFSEAFFQVGILTVSGQSLYVIAVSIVLMVVMAWWFASTLFGKALRATAVNRVGARLVGISPELAGSISFSIAAAIGVLSGMLIAPLTTIYYDSGFVIGLKGFVAAIIGGLISYPLAAAGAIFVGVVESFASFWASAFREVIVFSLIIPVLLLRSLGSRPVVEDGE